MAITGTQFAAMPRFLRRLVPDYEKARAQADYLGLLDKFDDVWILGNEEMKARPGLPYEPIDIIQTLVKYDGGERS